MSVRSKAELMQALENLDFKSILYTPECSWLDFKRSRYATAQGKPLKLSDYGKGELCKDVAEFANHEGGIILLGVEEVKSPTTGLSVASKIVPIPVSSIDLPHYKQVLMAQIYPLVEGVEMKWFTGADKKGLLAIVIPKSKDILHILRQVYDADGNRLRGLEIPVRADDQTYLFTAESLSERINRGKPQSTSDVHIPTRTSFGNPDIAKVRANIAKQTTQIRDDAKRIRDQVVEMNDWSEQPVYILQAIPFSGKDRLDGFYDSLKQSFAYVKPIRGMGFNLNSLGRETSTVDGAFVKTGIRDGAIRLDPNGTLTMVLVASESFLGWGVNRSNTGDHMYVNSVVLSETALEFTKFVEEHLRPAGLDTWKYNIDIRNFKKFKVTLCPGRPGNYWEDDGQLASKDEFEKFLDSNDDYELATYDILTEVYAFFTLPERAIPYITEKRVTAKSIVSINAMGR